MSEAVPDDQIMTSSRKVCVFLCMCVCTYVRTCAHVCVFYKFYVKHSPYLYVSLYQGFDAPFTRPVTPHSHCPISKTTSAGIYNMYIM